MLTPRARGVLLRSFLACALAAPASADPVTTSTLGWAVNGIVSEVARAGNIAYVGGSFASVAPSPNLVFGFAAFKADSATPVLPRLDLNGRVRAVVALPGGGWIVGGEFTQVNGASRGRLVKLRADGTVDPAFTASANDTVWALVAAGGTVYAGGEFTSVNSTTRNRLARLDAATGALDGAFVPSFTGGSSPSVCALLLSGARLLVGGTFTTASGMAHQNVAAVDATSGAVVPAFTGEADGRVAVLTLAGSDVVAAGEFDTIGGLARRGVARLDATTGAAVAGFNAQSSARVNSVAVSGATVFVGGTFSQIGGTSRARIAQLDLSTGTATAWNPGANGEVEQLGLFGTALIAAGHYTQMGGTERLRLAALSTTGTTDVVLSWNPSLDSSADLLHVDAAGFVFAGGSFNYFGAVPRENLAAIDLATGGLLNWNPGANGWVRALDISGSTVFIGGDFLTIGGADRHYVAALDGVTGVVSSWNPRPDNIVKGLQVLGTTVYFVGEFTHVGVTTARGRGAAASLDGTVLPWNPAANGTVETLFAIGSRVYLGGAFTMAGGASRALLAAVDATAGTAEPSFAPAVSGSSASVIRVDVLGDTVFFGGRFSMVNGSTRNNAAAALAAPGAMTDGQLLGWNPNVSGPVYDIDAFGDDVYLVGGFGAVGGSSRPGIAMVDALPAGGALRAWRPVDVAGGSVSVIDASETAVLFGGLLYDLNYLYIGAVLYPEAGLPGVPPPPTTPRATLRGNALTIDWGAPPLGARPSSYVIEAGTAPGLSNLANVGTGTTATTISGNGLGAGVYYLRMRAANAFGASAVTPEQAFVVGASGCSGPPLPPLDLRATVAGANLTLDWRAAPASIVSSYRLIVGLTSGGAELGSHDVGFVTRFSVAAPDGAYFIRAVAVNACGAGPASFETPVVIGTPVVPPIAPFAFAATMTGSTATFTWAAPPVGTGPFQFRIEAGTAPGLANLANVALATNGLVVPGVPAGIYYLRVRAVGAGGVGPASNEVTLVVP